jgi:hypothetical protein
MTTDHTAIFDRLKRILQTYEPQLVVVHDEADHYYLDTTHTQPNGNPLFFGAVRTGRQVTFHLMPVYTSPDLLDDVSDDLKRRMQGKSCFNFRKVDEQLFDELTALVERGFEQYRANGYVE